MDVVAVARDVELVERLDRRFRLAFGGAEGGEIVLADQALRGRVHGRGIERPRHAPGAAALEREIGAAVDDAIEIVALDRREARVEVVGDLLGREHRDRMRAQMRVERIAHGVASPVLGEIDMRDLAERMHAGVGAPGAADVHALARRTPRSRRPARPAPTAPLSWICQPTNGVPSYSMVSL